MAQHNAVRQQASMNYRDFIMTVKTRHDLLKLVVALLVSVLPACSDQLEFEDHADAAGHTQATQATVVSNQEFARGLPFDNKQDFDDARRGLIATPDALVIHNKAGVELWNMPAYDFVGYSESNADVPPSVNPSLWRQAALNNIHGLFKVTDGIYQIRGFDLANMTIIEGQTGWIVVDPLTSAETAQAALSFAQQHLGVHPVRAVLFTHSHIDHFGGIQGILSRLSAEQRENLRIIAPKGFLEEATSENIIAGSAMSRRAMFMYGKRLQRSERGHVGSGLGKGPAFGSFGIALPTEIIEHTPTRLDIDGIDFVFQFTPASEAPAEFTFYLPKQKAFCGAELVSRNLHNLYTLRGAKVRDALAWSAFIEEARELFVESQVYFGSHHWPMWGSENIQHFLSQQRDTYQYIHDQSVRLMNAGLTSNEIAEQITLPESLRSSFANRGYYGTVKHNAKAVYQAYMGWFNGNPAFLDPLPEEDAAKRSVELMGGVNELVKKAQGLFDKANKQTAETVSKDYRWIAQLLNMAVFAEPDNVSAKMLLAKTYDQLAYQSESAPWRDFYLSGAFELRNGPPETGIDPAVMKQVLMHTPVEKFFQSMAVSLNGPKADGEKLRLKVHFTDLNQSYLLLLENSVLRHKRAEITSQADATLNLTHPLFVDIIVGDAGLKETLFGDDLSIEGSKLDLLRFFSLIDKPMATFNIVEP